MALEASTSLTVPFHMSRTGTASYEILARDQSTMDVCIIPEKEKQFWVDGQAIKGYACNNDINTVRDSAEVPSGNYYFAVRCENNFADCDFSYDLRIKA